MASQIILEFPCQSSVFQKLECIGFAFMPKGWFGRVVQHLAVIFDEPHTFFAGSAAFIDLTDDSFVWHIRVTAIWVPRRVRRRNERFADFGEQPRTADVNFQ